MSCGGNDITAAWKSIIPSTTITFSSQGGGCKLAVVNTSTACVETEEMLVTNPGTNATTMWAGVTSCSPAMCKFTANDAPCVVGDRARTMMGQSLVANGVRITFTNPTTAPDDVCRGAASVIVLAPQ